MSPEQKANSAWVMTKNEDGTTRKLWRLTDTQGNLVPVERLGELSMNLLIALVEGNKKGEKFRAALESMGLRIEDGDGFGVTG